MRKVRWGILSTAQIGTRQVIPAMQRAEHCDIMAIASRELGKAQEAATALGIAKAYGSYEELLADQEIEAIYNPLPNHLHVPLTLQALEAGKHVLCEKPIAMTAPEAQQLLDATRRYPQLKVMEAFMYRFHPQWQLAKGLVDDGKIGELRTVQSFFSYFLDDPSNVRNQAEIGGGGLLDIGCYTVSFGRFLFGAEPRRVCGSVDYDPVLKVDRLASGILEFAKGTSTFTCATQLAPYQRVNIFGTTGRIEIEIPVNAPADRPCKLTLQANDTHQEIVLDTADQYRMQGEQFSLAILHDTPVPTPLEDAVANMRVLDAVVESARTGRWI